jgi:hypothetical protein
MGRDRDTRASAGRADDRRGVAPAAAAPGRRSRTAALVQRRSVDDAPTARRTAPRVAHDDVGDDTLSPIAGGMAEAFDTWRGPSVQLAEDGSRVGDDGIHAVAASGASGAGAPLPFGDIIQGAFGPHDVSGIHSHTGAAAQDASAAIGATAYATGSDVVFSGAPDLHTAAHEAAHVVQQRAGVLLLGGVGTRGDAYEHEADAVADRVVAGGSAASLLAHYAPLTGVAGSAAVQKQASPANASPRAGASPEGAPSGSHVDEPVGGDNRPGFIDSDDGANIRTRPAELAGSQTLTPAPLPPATQVFVSGRHPETAEWWYVTAFLPDVIVRGYVQGLRVATDLPEPTAKLYQVKSGDTAEALAVKESSSAVRDGHDLRYYENVLLFVNRQAGRAGVRGSFQDPGLLGGGANNVQLEAGRRIWLPSPAYARALVGVVPDGSLTNGAVAKVKRFAGHLEDILASVTESWRQLGDVAGEHGQAIHDHLAEIIGIVAGFIMAEALSTFLAATPTGVGQIAAVMIQLALAVFGAHGMAVATVQAGEHAVQWLNLAWTADGKDDRIAAASREFIRMLVSVAMAALAYLGVKGNISKAHAIADSIPTALPAFAIAEGVEQGAADAAVAVKTRAPAAPGPVGNAMAMSAHGDEGNEAPDLAEPTATTGGKPYSAPTATGEAARGKIPVPTGGAVGTPPTELLSGGKLKVSDLMDLVPAGTPNTFGPSGTIPHGFKFRFRVDGKNIEIKVHSPDANANQLYPGSNSGTTWTAQVKVGNKLLGQDGRYYNNPSNITHIPVEF